MPTGTPAREDELLELTRQVVTRWGVRLPDQPRDIHQSVKIALREAADVAGKTTYSMVYPDDHSWMSTGLRGLSVERLREDERPTGNSGSGEEWGIAAIVTGYEQAIVVPLLADLDADAARGILEMVDSRIGEFICMDEVPALLSRDADPEMDGELEVQLLCSSWMEIRDLAHEYSCLPLSKAVQFRTPVVFDLLRAELSGASCTPLKPFSEQLFQKRCDLSIRSDWQTMKGARELLDAIKGEDHDLNRQRGVSWVFMMMENLNMIGDAKPMEGLSVLISFQVLMREDDGMDDALPAEFKQWEPRGVRTVCIGLNLDPVQALALSELAKDTPESLCDFSECEDGLRFEALGVVVVPDMHLASMKPTINGRDADAYDRLVEATARPEAA